MATRAESPVSANTEASGGAVPQQIDPILAQHDIFGVPNGIELSSPPGVFVALTPVPINESIFHAEKIRLKINISGGSWKLSDNEWQGDGTATFDLIVDNYHVEDSGENSGLARQGEALPVKAGRIVIDHGPEWELLINII